MSLRILAMPCSLPRYRCWLIEARVTGIDGSAPLFCETFRRQGARRDLSDAVAQAVERAEGRGGKPDRRGWMTLTIPIESVEHAALELLRVGPECEVLAPTELRTRMKETTGRMAELYRE